MNIYIGNLSETVNDQHLRDAFSEYGKIKNVKVIKDMFSGRCKGFAFVEMYSKKEGQKAIEELNTTELEGQKMIVNEARPQKDKKRGGFGGKRR